MAQSSRRRSWLSSFFCLDKWFRLAERRTQRQPRVRLDLETLEARTVPAAPTFTALANPAPGGIGEMMLLTNGTIMAQDVSGTSNDNISNMWEALTPSANGSFVNGTWSALAPMNTQRLFFGSAVMEDGRVFVIGGEYDSSYSGFSNTYEIYNPASNTWTSPKAFPQTIFGDDPVEVLPNGKLLLGYVLGPQTYLYDPTTNNITATGTKLYNDRSDEEAWVKLPDGSILSYDVFSGIQTGVFAAQRYIPATGTWVDASNTTGGLTGTTLSTTSLGYELGPAFLLPNGKVLQIGATDHTAIYDPVANSWSPGPDIPGGYGMDDAPGAILADGQVIFEADSGPTLGTFSPPSAMFDYDYNTNTITNITSTLPGALQSYLSNSPAYDGRMVTLPNGQTLFAEGDNQLYAITPAGTPQASWRPTITSITGAGPDYTLTGTQINGLNEGSGYGDDAMEASNYPIIQLTGGGGTVYDATTFNWTSVVDTGNTPETTQFTLPAGIPDGTYTLTVSANGISSAGISVSVSGSVLETGPHITTTTAPLAYFISQPATAIDPGVVVTDPGSLDLTGATVAITTGDTATDTLGFTNQNGISGSFAGNTLTLTGTASIADYQTALESVTYVDTNLSAPAGSRTITFTVTDPFASASGTRKITLSVASPIVSPNSLPAAKIAASYSETITASNGIAPFTLNITAGVLPAGLMFDAATGVISGTPTQGGTFHFTVTATDSSTPTGQSGSRTYVLTVVAPTIVVAPTSLPTGKVGVSYSQGITASGGTAPYTFTTASTLPAGLTLSTTGTLSGTPTGGGDFIVAVEVTDSSTGNGPYSVTETYSLTINPPTITITPNGLAADTIGTPYSATITASGGTLPYSNMTIVTGALPAGMSLDGTAGDPNFGVLSGTPTEAGTFSFTVSVTDDSSGTGPYTATKPFTLVVAPPTLTFGPSSLPSTQTGVGYTATIALTGGTAPYTYVIADGALPAGLTLNLTSGTISGVATAGGTFNFTVEGTDSSTGSGPFTASKAYSIIVNAPSFTFSPTTLATPQVGVSYTQALSVSGGVAPYTFTIGTGALPAGLTINFRTGTISGTPKAGGFFSFTIEVTDTSGGTGPFSKSQSYSLNVAAPVIAISPGTLPNAAVGDVYLQPIVATSGTAPYAYVITTGTLPQGMSLNAATGAIGGMPTGGGSFTFTIKATDSSTGTGPYSATQIYTLDVTPPTITFTPATLNNTTVGAAVNVTLTPTGGTAPYTDIQMTGGTLPAGLNFSASGVLSGTPTAGGTFTFTVAATDSSTGSGPYTGTQNYTLVVAPPVLVFTPATLANVQVGVPVTLTLGVSGGTAPYSNISLGSGALPAGLTLSTTGILTGTPTAGGTFNFTIVATDSSTGTGPYTVGQNFSLIVKPPTFVFNPPSLPGAQVAMAYNASVSASGGTAPYTNFAVTGGALPAGLSLNSSTGAITGTPTAGGAFAVTISATDSSTGAGPYTEGGSYTLNVAPPTLFLSPTTLIGGETSVPLSQTFTAGGGDGPYTFIVSAGKLPAGLALSPGGVLSGTPTTTGTANFSIKATDSTTGAGPYSVIQPYSMVIYPRIAITTSTLPTYWALNMPGYSQTIATTGGTGSVTYSISSGALPNGLSLDPNTGLLSGTPTGTPDGIGNFNFGISATDSVGAVATEHYTVTINPPNFIYTPSSMTLTISGTNFQFTQATTADASGTHTSYNFAMDSFSETLPDTVLSSVIVTGASAGATATLITSDTYIGTDGLTHEISQSVVLGNGGGQLMKTNAAGNAYTFLQLNNFSSTYAYLGHTDTGRLNATAGASNIFVTAGGYSYMVAPASFSLISGGAYVYGYAAGPTDQAWQYDGSGPSTFVVKGTTNSTMSGTDNGQAFFNEAVGFTVNYGIAKHPGQDVAYIYNSAFMNNFFVGGEGISYMYADNSAGSLAEFDEAEGFATVYANAFSVGGTNVAYNHDPSENILDGWTLAAIRRAARKPAAPVAAPESAPACAWSVRRRC